MMKIISTRERSANEGVKILVYGKPGVGKTRMAMTCETPLILSVERHGLLSLADQDISSVDVTMFGQAVSIVEEYVQSPEAQARFRTIVIDSLSALAEMKLEEELKYAKDGRRAYGEMALQVKRLVNNLINRCGAHVYCIAKEGETAVVGTEKMCAVPLFPGSKFQSEVPYLFHIVGRLSDEGLAVKGTDYFQAKDRTGALSPVEPKHIGKIIHKILSIKLTEGE